MCCREPEGAELLFSRGQILDAKGGREALAAFETDLAPQHPGPPHDEPNLLVVHDITRHKVRCIC